jgi:hypothetical protein
MQQDGKLTFESNERHSSKFKGLLGPMSCQPNQTQSREPRRTKRGSGVPLSMTTDLSLPSKRRPFVPGVAIRKGCHSRTGLKRRLVLYLRARGKMLRSLRRKREEGERERVVSSVEERVTDYG